LLSLSALDQTAFVRFARRSLGEGGSLTPVAPFSTP
jgi:hypothetical protein